MRVTIFASFLVRVTLISWNKVTVAQGNGILRFCNLLTTIFRHPMQGK